MPFPPITGPPSLERVVGEGDSEDVDIGFHTQAPGGVNHWAGTDNQGMPLPLDGNLSGKYRWGKGTHATKEGVIVPRATYPRASKQ